MSEAPKGGVTTPVVIAAILSLAVVLLRLYGELNGWSPKLFNPEAGGGGALVGITWLVPVFGFWFGRRLAQGGHRPKSTGRALLFCVLGIALVAGIFYVAFGTTVIAPESDFRTKATIAFPACGLCGLLLLPAWSRAWGALALYGALARAPVIVIQHLAFARGWKTHFNAVGKDGPQDAETLNYALTLVEGIFWPFGFTVLVGGIFAAIGAATVRQH